MNSEIEKSSRLYRMVKRFFDIIFSLIGLILTMPITFIFAMIILADTPGNPIFKQIRLGKNKKTYVIYKLRSMYEGSHRGVPSWTEVDDKRITKVGCFIRKYHIDELPQLLNVFKGDMSIIGPRPEVPELSEKFEAEYSEYGFRTMVKPGITGWAQVNGGYSLRPREKSETGL